MCHICLSRCSCVLCEKNLFSNKCRAFREHPGFTSAFCSLPVFISAPTPTHTMCWCAGVEDERGEHGRKIRKRWLFFLKHVYWKLWSAAVKCNCGMYVTIFYPVFTETCTEHEHTTDTQNEKEKTSPEFVFVLFFVCFFKCWVLKILFIQKYFTVKTLKKIKKVQYPRKRKSQVKIVVLQSRVNDAVRDMDSIFGCVVS